MAITGLAGWKGGPESMAAFLQGQQEAEQLAAARQRQAMLDQIAEQERQRVSAHQAFQENLAQHADTRAEAEDAQQRFARASAAVNAAMPGVVSAAGTTNEALQAGAAQTSMAERGFGLTQGTLAPMLAGMSTRMQGKAKAHAADILEKAEKQYNPDGKNPNWRNEVHVGIYPASEDSLLKPFVDEHGSVPLRTLSELAQVPIFTGQPAAKKHYQRQAVMVNGKQIFAGYDPDTDTFHDPDTGTVLRGVQPIPPASIQINNAGQGDVDDQAQQLVDGNIVPSMMSRRSSSFNAILAKANKLSKQQTGKPVSLVKLQNDYLAAQTHAKSINGTNPTRFRTLANSVVNTIDRVQETAEQLNQGNTQLWNKTKRDNVSALWGNTPYSQLAAQYRVDVNTLKEEFANLINGGYAPTEAAFSLANSQVNENYGFKDMAAALPEIKRLVNYRLSALEDLPPLLPSQQGQPKPESPAGGGKPWINPFGPGGRYYTPQAR